MFINLVESFGVRGAELAEIWFLNYYYVCYLTYKYRDIYCLAFLFKWEASTNDNRGDKNNAGGAKNSWRGGG